ncbi:MAG: hybrid sensor histidine kinase/response regulator [Beggiatoa sp. IS2]|nr:MAG: hybrid sensor histidine kinase/response regulator [Beggiatoa sp. IS2]
MNDNTLPKDTLLVIDDIPENVKLLLNFLTNAGFKVLIAQDGEEGIRTAEYVCPDLILLDVMMPDVDGFEVCQILKSEPRTKDIPIIFMTALADTLNKIRGFELGAADYITKPFHQEEVLARVTAHLNLRRMQRQLQTEIDIRKGVEKSLQNTADLLTERTIELEKRNMELDAFAHTVAHDLKNPLSAIVGLAEMLVNDCTGHTSTLEKLKVIAHASQQMFNIIDAMLLLAGVSKKAKIEHLPLDMAQIVSQVLQQRLLQEIKEYQAEIHLPDNWPSALGYAPWIEEVWANYLSNALKYGGHPPHLELGADIQEGNMIRFWVRDNGIGLTPKAQAQLFTPFTRLHKNRAEGHGLGLSIVQQIVEKLGGQVGVDSKHGQGSLFYFTLPRI